MPIYVCAECGYETTHKYRMIDHLEKKNPCPNQVIVCDMSLLDALKNDLTLFKTKNIIIKNERKNASSSPEP